MSDAKLPFTDVPQGLTQREREILRLVVRSFVETAGPVGSRFLAKTYPLGLSAASIRNTMSDLEEQGFLDHPYTSAGRVPTELGYRTFVDELMETVSLPDAEKELLRAELERLMGDTEELLRESTRLLGRLSNLLGIALSPKLSSGVLDRLEVVPLSSSRVMIVVSVHGGLVKTIVLEMVYDVNRRQLDRIVSLINERLAGLTLQEIRETYESRLWDLRDEETGIVRLVLDESHVVFDDKPDSRRLRYGGQQHILSQPEFQEPDEFRNVVELLEDEQYTVQLLERQLNRKLMKAGQAVVSIGREHSDEKAERFSIVTARYQVGESAGTIGVIGPTRMNYPRVVALVEGMAALLGGREADADAAPEAEADA